MRAVATGDDGGRKQSSPRSGDRAAALAPAECASRRAHEQREDGAQGNCVASSPRQLRCASQQHAVTLSLVTPPARIV